MKENRGGHAEVTSLQIRYFGYVILISIYNVTLFGKLRIVYDCTEFACCIYRLKAKGEVFIQL